MKSQTNTSRNGESAQTLTDALSGRRSDRARWALAAHNRVLRRVNQEPKAPPVVRVVQFLQLLKRVENLRVQLYKARKYANDGFRVETNYSQDPFGPEENDDLKDESDPKLRELNDCLSEIRAQLKRLHWTLTVRSFSEFDHLEDTYIWPEKGDQWENWAILLLIRQIKGAGQSEAPIMRFKQCQQCSAWFYALTDHQMHCSARCRRKFYSQSPKYRDERAKYMREKWRPLEKERKSQSKKKARQLAAERRKGEA